MAEETKAEMGGPTAKNVTPFEIEEGKAGEVRVSTAAVAKPPQQTTCQRHRKKFICLGVTLTLLGALGIAAAVLWPRMPTYTLYSTSSVAIDGLTQATANMVVKIDNPNKFAISFSNMEAQVYDYNDAYIGTIYRPDRFMVPAKSTGYMEVKGVFRTNLIELGAMGVNCLENNLMTKVRIVSTQDINLAKRKIRYTTTVIDNVPCSAQNVGGAAAGGGGNGAGGANGGPSVVNQVGDAINNGINQVFGGGGAGGARAGGAGAGAPPA